MESLRADLASEVERVADRLRSMSQAKLTGPVLGHTSRAHAARSAAQALADAAAVIEAGCPVDAAALPAKRPVPVLSEFAAGDQVAVTGHDLILALEILALEAPLPHDIEPTATALVTQALEQLRTLRRLL